MYICFDIIIEYYDVYKVRILFILSNELVEIFCIYIFDNILEICWLILKKNNCWFFFKVEIIGDVYMVVSGFLVKNGLCYVSEIVIMVLDFLSSVVIFEI